MKSLTVDRDSARGTRPRSVSVAFQALGTWSRSRDRRIFSARIRPHGAATSRPAASGPAAPGHEGAAALAPLPGTTSSDAAPEPLARTGEVQHPRAGRGSCERSTSNAHRGCARSAPLVVGVQPVALGRSSFLTIGSSRVGNSITSAAPRAASQSTNSLTGTLAVIATWWISASASTRSGLPRSGSGLRSSPRQPRPGRRVGEVHGERQDPLVALVAQRRGRAARPGPGRRPPPPRGGALGGDARVAAVVAPMSQTRSQRRDGGDLAHELVLRARVVVGVAVALAVGGPDALGRAPVEPRDELAQLAHVGHDQLLVEAGLA